MTQLLEPATRAMGVRVAAACAAVVALGLLGNVIWSAAVAGAGLLVLGGICIVGIGLLQALPLLGQKWENKLLALRKQEARLNPIEQLQSFMAQKAQRVQQFRASVIAIGTQIKSLEQMVADRKKQRRDYDAAKQERQIEAMQAAHARLIDKLQRAEIALQLLAEKVEDKKFEWKFSQAGQASLKSLNASGGQELVEEMLADEAFDSVRDNFNQVFAELELESAHLSIGTPIDPLDGEAWGLPTVSLPARQQPVPRRHNTIKN
ncbi:hypothetical protein [Ideonella sp.]|uniref:hypothetical protein n=1 Tax=Ideonella sp. TaxID=1929293 RepID=UPI0035B2C4FE